MLYSRSSFIKYLTEKKDCEIRPLENGVLRVSNGPCYVFMGSNKRDRIDYEEIYMVCQRLFLDLPGDSDLVRIE